MGVAPARIPAPSFRHVWGGIVQRIFVLNALQAWTGEEGGRIGVTLDGGATWHFQTTPNEIDGYVRAIHFLRRGPMAGQRGWAVGSNGRLITTTNGGVSWALVGSQLLYAAGDPDAGQPIDLFDVFFQDELNGWITGIRALRRTSDGGQSWTDLMPLNPNVPSTAELYRFAFLGPGPGPTGVLVGEPGLILRSLDGTTWSTVLEDFEFCSGLSEHLELWDVQFKPSLDPDTAVGYAVGGQGNQCGGALSTTDGGATWTRELQSEAPPSLYAVTPLAQAGAIACGYAGTAYKRVDATPEWLDIRGLIDPPAASVRVPMWGAGSDDAATAWIVGVVNHVFRTADSGASWTRQRGAGAWRLRDIHFLDTTTGWAVAELLTVLHSDDGGVTWSEELGLPGPTLNAVRFLDANRGVVVGSSAPGGAPSILHYDPAQAPNLWQVSTIVPPPVRPPANTTLWSATWVPRGASADTWAVGTKGLVMRSTDGSGRTWSYFPGPAGSDHIDFSSISFDGVNALYVVGFHRGTGATHAYRLRYPALSWEDLTIAVGGIWRAIVAQGVDVYAMGSSSPTEGVVYKFDPNSPAGIPHWDLVYPTPGARTPQNLWTGALIGQGANQALFAGGERGAVLRLQGGLWASLKSQTSVTLTGMSFLSASRGFAVGHGSVDGQGLGSPGGLGDSALVGYA